MEILIRNLDRSTVHVIDEIAKKQGKSRNEFLKEQLTLFALAPNLRQQEEKFESIIKEVGKIIEKNTEIIKKIIDE